MVPARWRVNLGVLLLGIIILSSGRTAIPEDEHQGTRRRLLALLESDDLEARVTAFEALRETTGIAGVRLGVEAVAALLRLRELERASAEKQVRETAKILARDWGLREKSNELFWAWTEVSAERPAGEAARRAWRMRRDRRHAAYRRARQETENSREEAGLSWAKLWRQQAEYASTRALLRDAAVEAGGLLARLSRDELPAALEILTHAWVANGGPETWLLWVDALCARKDASSSEALRRAVSHREWPARFRALALDGLVAVSPAEAVEHATRYLVECDVETEWHMVVAAIEALRSARVISGILPLITFLERQSIGRLRGDAHQALVALTHQPHGPYADPWRRWWEDAHESFRMPAGEPDMFSLLVTDTPSTRFYGITTFSDRVLYMLDVSTYADLTEDKTRRIPSSMRSGKEHPVLRARRELLQSVSMLSASARFSVIGFHEEVKAWRRGPVENSQNNRRSLEKWLAPLTGLGHPPDFLAAFDAAFEMARSETMRPGIDTIFILTEGDFGFGLARRAEGVANELRAWNRVERIQIHVVDLGEVPHTRPIWQVGRGGRHIAR